MFGKSRQGFYKLQFQQQSQTMQQALILDQVRALRISQQRVGTRRLLQMLGPVLDRHGIKMGRDKLFDLLAANQLLVRRRKRKKSITTDSNHPFRRYPNLIQGVVAKVVNQVWVSDITYLSLAGGKFCYLSLVTDVYSRKIVGYQLHPGLQKEGPMAALQMALEQRKASVFFKTTHHSDRGIQYCCHAYTDILRHNDIAISMTQQGDPAENALAERVNGILKTELGLAEVFGSFAQAQWAVSQAVDTYNRLRLHSSCDYLTPDQAYEKASGVMKKRWSSPAKSL
ncbi:IS3 family transposase [Chitinophaga lutea]